MADLSVSDVVKASVRKQAAYTLKHVDADVKIDQNENPWELPSNLKQEIVNRVLARPWGRYPEFVPKRLTETLSRFTGWTEEGILVGNGSNELIQAALMVCLGPGRKLTLPQPTFTLYRLMASMLEADIDEIRLTTPELHFDIDALIESARRSTVTVICNPNNPTGTLLDRPSLERLLTAAGGLVLLDEAYHEFSGQSALELLPRYSNLAVLRTSSKALAMAGLRFGYMLAHPDIAREIHKAKLPYNVNIFTLTAAEVAIEHRPQMDAAISRIVSERERLYAALQTREGVEVWPSAANFLLIRTAFPAGKVFDAIYSAGVLVRNVSAYPMLDRCLRVSVGTPEENNRFLEAMDRALEGLS